MATKIDRHTCVSRMQDSMYGYGQRVWNERKRNRKHIGWRCTICGLETVDNVAPEEKKEEKPV